MPKFSLLVTVYNGQEWLIDCLRSVLGQDCEDWECLIGDDASTDDTVSIIRAASEKDERIKPVIASVNVGGGENIANLMRLAKGEVSVELGGDDYFSTSQTLSRILREYDAKPTLDATSGSFVITPRGGVIAHPPDKLWWRRWCYAKPLTWRTELGVRCLEEFHDLQVDPETGLMPRYGWDVAIYLPIIYKARKYKTIYDVLYAYREHESNDCNEHRYEQIVTERRITSFLDSKLSVQMPWWPKEDPVAK